MSMTITVQTDGVTATFIVKPHIILDELLYILTQAMRTDGWTYVAGLEAICRVDEPRESFDDDNT